VSVTLSALQVIPSLFVVPDVSVTLIEGIGSDLTVIVVDVVEEHPSALVNRHSVGSSSYRRFADCGQSLSCTPGIRSRLLHHRKKPRHADTGSAQIVPSFDVVPDVSVTAMIEGIGRGLTVIVVDAVAVHPSALVTVTVYVVVVVGETTPDALVFRSLLQE
jgi:hypothetical protein